MNIAVFAPYDLAAHGGIASHIRSQARALRGRGHTVSVYGPASEPLGLDETAVVRPTTVMFGGTSSGAGFDPRAWARVGRIFQQERFDVVHVHEPLMPLLPWIAVSRANAPVVGTFHVYRESGHRWYPLARPLLDVVMRRVRARIAVSDAALRTAAQFFPGDYEIVPNGIEVSRFQRNLPRPREMPASGSLVLCVGRLEKRKGISTLVDAMSRVRRRIPDATLVLVGDGPERESLEARSRSAAVPTTIVRGVDDAALPAFYQAADVVCAPALGGESFGIVLIEALAAGKPVVASGIDGYVAAVGESSCVRWATPGDPSSLAASLIMLLEDRRMTWRAEATRIAQNYDWARIAGRLEAIYTRVQWAGAAAAAPHV